MDLSILGLNFVYALLGAFFTLAFMALGYRVFDRITGLAPVSWTGTDLGFKHSAAAVSSRS